VFLGLVLHLGWILVVVQPDLARRLMLLQAPKFQQRYSLRRERVQGVLREVAFVLPPLPAQLPQWRHWHRGSTAKRAGMGKAAGACSALLAGTTANPILSLPPAPIRRLQRAIRRAGPQGGEGVLEPLALLLHQALGTLQPEGAAVGEQPAAQRRIAFQHPGRQGHLHPVGMARVRSWGQHSPGFRAVLPPAVAGQGLAQADCLGWIAIELAADGFGQRLPLPFRQPSTPR
jgi:hypothetical protein